MALRADLEARGWNVKLGSGEADLDIARDCRSDDIVLTKDSDTLGYNNIRTIWRLVGKHKALQYDTDDVCIALGFESRAQLTALAVVSSNDYQRNIPTLGPATNLSILKRTKGVGKQLSRNAYCTLHFISYHYLSDAS